MTSIAQDLTRDVSAAFAAVGLPAELGVVLESGKPGFAPYQCNGAMAAAKPAKRAPRKKAAKKKAAEG